MQTTSKGAKSKDHVPFNRKKGKRIPSGVLEGMNRTARSSNLNFFSPTIGVRFIKAPPVE